MRSFVAGFLLCACAVSCTGAPEPRRATAASAEWKAVDSAAAPLSPALGSSSSASARDVAARRARPHPVFEGTGILESPRPRPDARPAPVYPEAARLAGREGETIIRVTVTTAGEPADAWIERSSGHADLDAAARAAALRWRFVPGTWRGSSVELDLLLPFRFELKAPAKIEL